MKLVSLKSTKALPKILKKVLLTFVISAMATRLREKVRALFEPIPQPPGLAAVIKEASPDPTLKTAAL